MQSQLKELACFLTEENFRSHPFVLYIKKNYSKVIVIGPGGSGGDAELARNFANVLHDTLFIDANSLSILSSYKNENALAFVFNLDTVDETSRIVCQLTEYNIDISIYTLHHPIDGIIAMNISKLFSSSILSVLIPSIALSGLLPALKIPFYLLRSLIAAKTARLPAIPSSYRSILRHCRYILVCSSKEKKAIINLVKDKDITILPHLIAGYIPSASVKPEIPIKNNPYVIIAGRSEYRKNLHSTIRLIRDFPCTQFLVYTTFCKSKPRESYQYKLLESFRGLPNCQLTLNASAAELCVAITNSAVFINPSWYEVNSMLDLVAIKNSVKLISTKYSWLDSDHENVYLYDPLDPDALRNTFLNIRDSI